MSSVFSFRFWILPHKMLAAVKAADRLEHADLPQLFDEALARMRRGESPPLAPWARRFPLAHLLYANRALVKRSALWGLASRLAILATVFIATRLFQDTHGLVMALALSLGYFATQVTGNVTQYFADVTRCQMDQAVLGHLAARLVAKLPYLDVRALETFSKGRVKVLAISDIQELVDFINTLLWNLIPALGSVVILGPVVFYLTGWPGLMAMGTAFLNIPVALWLSRLIERQQSRGQNEMGRMTTLLGEWVRNMRLVRYLSWQPFFERDISLRLRRYMRAYLRRHAMMCVTFGISFSWWMMPVIALFLSARWLQVPLSMERFFATLWILKDLGDYLAHLPHAINLQATASVSLRRLDEFTALPETRQGFDPYDGPWPAAAAVPVALRGERVRVSFAKGEMVRPALQDISFRFELDRRYAVTGGVGAGKSVLLRVLAGDLKPTAGRLEVEFSDGTRAPLWVAPIYERWRQMMAAVPADPFISNGTLAVNISLWDEPLGEAALLQALHMADLMQDTRAFPRGIHEEIGEVGINLSGGQRQRLTLARAFYSGRPFLLLDDPLSAVDHHTEANLMTQLSTSGRGFVMTTHRLAHLALMDEVWALEDGCLVREGTS